ncbi:MAG: hypothetical protein QOE65_2243 [Solirubrobacteraceae bacterium]|jgi:hypothetical protein|nr:hypothetical protein [Solirubrobacteraceae bacterium]
MTPRRYIPLLAVAVTAVPASASAQAPATPTVTLQTAGTQTFERGLVAVAGDRVEGKATAANAAPGSTLTLTFVQGGRTLRTVRQVLATGAGEAAGNVTRPPGLLTIRARVGAPGAAASSNGGSNAEDAAATPSALARVTLLEPSSTLGARGLRVRFLQRRLAAMGFAIRLTGVHDFSTSNAILAHRKVLGLPRVGWSDAPEFRAAAAGRGAYTVRYPLAGRHVEGDLTKQVLALIEPGGRIAAVYHTSSGRPRFKTPLGVHTFWRKELGLNDRGMLHSVYFTHDKTSKPTRPACAIHGYFVVPTFNNSHCCFRVPLADALTIYRWTRLGERIYVYRS